MKGKLLLLLLLAFLVGCKEEDMSPTDEGINRAILEKYIWKNDILIDEVFTDNSTPESYIRTSTLSFTQTQYTHRVQDATNNHSAIKNLSKQYRDPKRVSEYWGDFNINGADSTLTLSYRVNNKITNQLNLSQDSLVIYSTYKIIHLSDDELTLKLTNDSVMNGYNRIMTYKPIK